MTNDPKDIICENTRYSFVRNDAIYALTSVIVSVELGRMNSHAACASRSVPHVLEYHSGTTGGNFGHAKSMLMAARREHRIAPRVARETMVLVERLFHPL